MAIEVFEATRCPEHISMGLTPGLWYYWVDNYRHATGGYKRFDQAEMAYQQHKQAMKEKQNANG